MNNSILELHHITAIADNAKLLVKDTTGEGHRTKNTEHKTRRSLFVTL